MGDTDEPLSSASTRRLIVRETLRRCIVGSFFCGSFFIYSSELSLSTMKLEHKSEG